MTNLFALTALLCWIPISAVLFLWLPIARALAFSYVGGWLILPVATYQLPGIPDFSKATAVLLASSLGLLMHKDAGQVLREFRLSWIDIPAFLLCMGVFTTSYLNGLGIWDGVSAVVYMFCTWTGPYFLGRLVFRSTDAACELVKAIFFGGLFYVPLCLFEIRMSPQLHVIFYGVTPRGVWSNVERFGGYRPNVFLEDGLELGLWMTASCLAGFVLWHQGRYRRIGNLPVSLLLFVLLVTTVLCKSTGALALLMMGLACSIVGRHFRSTMPMAILVVSAIAYIIVRGAGLYDGAEVVEFTKQYVSEDRAGSLNCRLKNEDLLREKAFIRPWLGWGSWGRSRVYNDEGVDISITDGRWIIIFGQLGVIGLFGTFGTLIFPSLAALRRYGGRVCCSESAAPVIALTMIVAVFAIDCLLNSFPNPVYLLSAGAVGSLAQLAPGHTFPEGAKPEPTTPGANVQRRCWPLPSRKQPAKAEG